MSDTRPAHHTPDGRFRNPWPGHAEHGLGSVFRWTFDRLLKGEWRRARGQPPALHEPDIRLPRAGAAEHRITWIGHSTFLLEVGGVNILTDPVLGPRASPVSWAGPRRLVPPGVAMAALPPVDVVLQSHDHYDHLDDASVRAIAKRHPEATWCAPLGVERQLRERGVMRVVERDWHGEGNAGAVRVTCVPARHFAGRTLTGRNATLWCGWIAEVAGHRVYFVGDSGEHPEFGEISRRYGPFDAVLMPIGAYDPRWFMRPVHVDPEEAVGAFAAIREAHPAHRTVMVAMHWGTFVLTDEPVDEPPQRVRAAWAARGWAADDLWIMAPGETRVLR
jgi:N-acyl-phosphatidylethanolamine-hydrolysing phospholipase D